MEGPPSAAALARRIERAEAEQLARTGPPGPEAARAVAGGLAVLKTRGSPFSMALGMGLAAPIGVEDLDEVEDHLGQAGAGVQVVVAAPAHPTLAAELGRRGYRLERLHQVWWRAPLPLPDAPCTAEVRPIRRSEESAWVHAFSLAHLHRPPPSPAAAAALGVMLRADGNVCFAAIARDEVVAVAIVSAHGGVATLSGAGVVPHHRGRGLQRALVRARLAWAAAAGCDLAASVTEPGGASQRTLERAGFRCAYPRAVMVRPAGA
jgi:GNAT superfamily N-acetyltransferase